MLQDQASGSVGTIFIYGVADAKNNVPPHGVGRTDVRPNKSSGKVLDRFGTKVPVQFETFERSCEL